MGLDYGFSELGNRLYEACTDYDPDFDKIEQLIAQGININAVSDDEPEQTLLSKIIYGHPQVRDILFFCIEADDCKDCKYYEDCDIRVRDADGRHLPQIIKVFLDHGFDCSRRNGQAGAMCLQNLTWSSGDRYILDAAKLLLDAGADPDCASFSDSRETVMDWVRTKISAAYTIDEDPEKGLLFTELYEILDAARTGKPYHHISL